MKNIFKNATSNTNFSDSNEVNTSNFNLKKDVAATSKKFFLEETKAQLTNKRINVNDETINEAANNFSKSMENMVSNKFEDLKQNIDSMDYSSSTVKTSMIQRSLTNAISNVKESSSKNFEDAVSKFVNSLI